MKQLITRMDDTLHARLKARAAAEGRSLNDLVTDVLATAVSHRSQRTNAGTAGQLAHPPKPAGRPSREQVLESTRGLGHATSEALEADRGEP